MAHNGKLLREFLNEYYLGTVTQFIENTRKSRQWVYNIFEEPKFSENDILILSNSLDVKKEFFFQYLENPQSIDNQIVSYQMELKKGNNYFEFLEKYYGVLESFVSEAKESIVIVNYLDDNESLMKKLSRSGEDIEHYLNIYKSYLNVTYDIIKKRLKDEQNQKFQYEVFFQLPLSTNVCDDVCTRGMSLLHKENIEHLEDVYSDYKDFRTYFLKTPVRPFSFIIVDGKHILTEYHYYNKEGMGLPDLAFIDRESKTTSQIIYSHLALLNKVRAVSDELTREEAIYGIAQLILMEYQNLDKILTARSPNSLNEDFPEKIENLRIELKSDNSERERKNSIKKLKGLIDKGKAFKKLTPKLDLLISKAEDLIEKNTTYSDQEEFIEFSEPFERNARA